MEQATFTIRLLPFNKENRDDKKLIFDDVYSVILDDYPKIEIQKYSDPIKVIMIVPEGFYLIEDHTEEK